MTGRLLELNVRDLALIERLRLELEPGLNVLTGETGAGKSLLIDALGLALGARADTTLVRHGADAARVEALFDRLPEPLIAAREVGAGGRSVARLDDQAVTAARLAETVGPLVEIHGQHDQSRLLDERWQRELLDAFGGHAELRVEMARAVERWSENRAALAEVAIEPREVERRLELLRHEVEEIGGARLRAGEADELRVDARAGAPRRGDHPRRRRDPRCAGRGGEGRSRRPRRRRSRGALAGPHRPSLRGRRGPARRAGGGARGRGGGGPAPRRGRRSRRARPADAPRSACREIFSLERRYGDDEAAVIAHGERAAAEVERLEGLADERRRREADDARLLAEVAFAASALSTGRRATAERLGAAADEALRSLGFRAGAFGVEVGRRIGRTRRARDRAGRRRGRVRCLRRRRGRVPVRAEPGRAAAPAGEDRLGRRAVARRAGDQAGPRRGRRHADARVRRGRCRASAVARPIPVGRSLWALARNHQVLVVTHLPQIAAHADAHFRIAKRERDGRTITEIERLDREGRIVELAAMLGGSAPRSDDPLVTKGGLVAVGPGPAMDDADDDLDLDAAEPRDLVADPPAAPLGSSALASARELLDAAEAWRGRPVVPV